MRDSGIRGVHRGIQGVYRGVYRGRGTRKHKIINSARRHTGDIELVE